MTEAGSIAVAGAGIAGLTSAIQLARRGHTVDIYERAAALSEVGAGIQLSPNVGRVLSALGLDDALDAVAVRPRSVEMRSAATGRLIARVPLGQAAEARFGAPYRVIHRADLQRVLLDAALASPSIRLHLDRCVTDVSQTDDAVSIDLSGEQRAAALLLACDGVWSALRPAVSQARAKPTGQTAWRTVIDEPGNAAEPVTELWLGPDVHIVRYPVAGGAGSNIVVVMADAGSSPAPGATETPGRLPENRLSRLDPSLRETLLSVSTWTRWPLFGVDPRAPWTKGRIGLLGDAAHAMLPFLAQGGAMAIEDATELAIAVEEHGATPQALVAYERRRKPRVGPIWREAGRLARVYHLGVPASLARDMALAALGPERLLRRMDHIYGWQPTTLPT
ncbi:FAD-dependent monooxygenase [Amorphus coralli]|uniref:FAD-dependent monooxygenase n=1 Tax=Amorphus coralli TaxID=340680 RepID=UPI000371EEC7|nr:FAD-dependent monooxygenase [Amorphus coralli]